MARQPRTPGPNPFADLTKKLQILEREMAVQQAALARLKALGEAPRVELTAEETHRSDVALNRAEQAICLKGLHPDVSRIELFLVLRRVVHRRDHEPRGHWPAACPPAGVGRS